MSSKSTAFAFGLAVSVIAALVASYLAARWSGPLSVFGEHLPASAALATNLAPWLFVIPGVLALLWAVGRDRHTAAIPIIVGIASLLLACILAVAMYIPLWKLAAVT